MQYFILIRTMQKFKFTRHTTNTGTQISIKRRYFKLTDSRYSNWEFFFSIEIMLILSKVYLKFDNMCIQSVTVIMLWIGSMLRLRSSAMINDLCNWGGEWFGKKSWVLLSTTNPTFWPQSWKTATYLSNLRNYVISIVIFLCFSTYLLESRNHSLYIRMIYRIFFSLPKWVVSL